MRTYLFRASRKSDGLEIRSHIIHDPTNADRIQIAAIVRDSLIESHPLARGLLPDDIILELTLKAMATDRPKH